MDLEQKAIDGTREAEGKDEKARKSERQWRQHHGRVRHNDPRHLGKSSPHDDEDADTNDSEEAQQHERRSILHAEPISDTPGEKSDSKPDNDPSDR